jgi:DNA-binding HxlR family transcriptional regulator
MMHVFGNRWAAALILAAFLGTTRFNEFQSQLGIPPSTLAERLQTFCAIGVLAVSPIDEGSQREEYLLTEKGRAAFPVLVLLLNWAQRWFHAPEGPAIILTHNDCGAGFQAELACDQCFETLSGKRIAPR